MYGSKRENVPPVIQKQNPHLGQLDTVVASREGLAALRDIGNLELALEKSRPASNVFEESLLAAKRELETARAMLSTGYDGSGELLRTAGTVANLADDLYEEMERKSNRGRKKRITEGN